MTKREPIELSEGAGDGDVDRPIWGVVAIAKVINRSARQTHYLLTRGLLDADKIGGRWVSTKRRLLAPFMKPKDAA